MIVLGSAHTHTYRAARDEGEAIPSIGDMESWEVPDLICGIVNVVEGSDGKKSGATSPRAARPATAT
jgi:hypothetical protein